jgi:methylsterol monooxygenase
MLPHTTDTYWNQFDEVSKYNVHLNYLERMWAAWYAYIGNDVLIVDQIPYFKKFKIQEVSSGRIPLQ